MRGLLFLFICLCFSVNAYAKEIYFQNVVGDNIAESVSVQLQKEVESTVLTTSDRENCKIIANHGRILFHKLSQYYDGEKFVLQTCKFKQGRLTVYYTINGRPCQMIVLNDPTPKNIFTKF